MEEQAQIDRAAIGRKGGLKTQSNPALALAIKEDKDGVIRTILDRALHGDRLADIAPDYGVSLQALQYQLMRHAMDEWRDVQAARSLAEYERNKEQIEEASDQLELARARDKIKCSHFELERLIPRLYGQKQEVTVTHRSDLAERIQAAERRIIDVTPEK
jgi:hypothetical protein